MFIFEFPHLSGDYIFSEKIALLKSSPAKSVRWTFRRVHKNNHSKKDRFMLGHGKSGVTKLGKTKKSTKSFIVGPFNTFFRKKLHKNTRFNKSDFFTIESVHINVTYRT